MYLFDKIKQIGSFLQQTDGTINKKILRSGIWVGLSKAGLNSLSLIRSIILARLLAPEVFGLISLCMVAIRGLEIFTQTGFNAALIQRQSQFEGAKSTAFTLMIIRGFVLCAVMIILAPFAAMYFEEKKIELILKILSVTFIFNGFYNINTIGFMKELNFKKLTYIEQVANITNFLIVVILAFILRNVWALIIGQVTSSFIQVLLSYLFIPGYPKIRFNRLIAKQLFSYGKYITGLTIVIFITTEIDNIVVGKILGIDLLGYYVIAYTLANFPAMHISRVISNVMFPAYSKLQKDLKELTNTYLGVLELVSKVTIPAAFGIGTLAPEIIIFVYGEKWIPAIIPLQILCIFGGFRAIASLNGYVYNAIGKPDIPFYMNTIKLLTICVIIYPFTIKFSLIGTAIAVTIPLILQYYVSIYILTRVISIKFLDINKVIIVATAKSFLMSAVLILFKLVFSIDSIIILFLFIILGILVYALLNLKELSNLLQKKSVIFN